MTLEKVYFNYINIKASPATVLSHLEAMKMAWATLSDSDYLGSRVEEEEKHRLTTIIFEFTSREERYGVSPVINPDPGTKLYHQISYRGVKGTILTFFGFILDRFAESRIQSLLGDLKQLCEE